MDNLTSWKEAVIKMVELLSEDKVIAIVALTFLGGLALFKYPSSEGLPILTSIVSGIAGFVIGSKKPG